MQKVSNSLLLATNIVAMAYLFILWLAWLFLHAAAQVNEGTTITLNTVFFSHMTLIGVAILLGWFGYLHKKSEAMRLAFYAYISSALIFVFAPFVAIIALLSYKSYKKELEHLKRIASYQHINVNRKID